MFINSFVRCVIIFGISVCRLLGTNVRKYYTIQYYTIIPFQNGHWNCLRRAWNWIQQIIPFGAFADSACNSLAWRRTRSRFKTIWIWLLPWVEATQKIIRYVQSTYSTLPCDCVVFLCVAYCVLLIACVTTLGATRLYRSKLKHTSIHSSRANQTHSFQCKLIIPIFQSI